MIASSLGMNYLTLAIRYPSLYTCGMTILSHIRKIPHRRVSWLQGFEQTQSLFVHVPKTAGTSIAQALYSEEPWHYPIRDYRFLTRSDFARYYKFAFIRNPYDRLYSAYLYSFRQFAAHPTTSVAFVTRYPSFLSFVNEWVTPTNIGEHYFFHPQLRYVTDVDGALVLDFLGRYERLEGDFAIVCEALGVVATLPFHNQNSYTTGACVYDEATAGRVYEAYEEDFIRLDYSEDSWKTIVR